MAWLPVQRGLAVPPQYGPIDPASPLSADLCSLWVPAIGQSDVGLINLAQNYQAPMIHGTGTTAPTLTSTEFGVGQRYDGQNDISLKTQLVPFSPHLLIRNTLAIVCRIDAMPVSPNYSTVYNFNNGTYIDGRGQIDIKSDRIRFWFTGNNGTNANYAEVNAQFYTNEVLFITACSDSYTTTRISVWEPRTGRFFTNTNTAGTNTQSSLATFPIENESLGGRYYNGFSDVFAAVTILDAWAWRRSLSDDNLELWRNNRWSVFQPNRADTALVFSQRSAAPGSVLNIATAYSPGSPTVVKSPIVLGKLFSGATSFFAGTAGAAKSAIPSGVVFQNNGGLQFAAPSNTREDASRIVREDGGYQFKEGSQPAVGQKYDVSVDPFVTQSILMDGSVVTDQSSNPAGSVFIRNTFLLTGVVGSQISVNVSGSAFSNYSYLLFGGQSFYREDGDFILREDGSIYQREEDESAASQLRANLTGGFYNSASNLIAGNAQSQRNTIIAQQQIFSDVSLSPGFIAKSLTVSGVTLTRTTSLAAGNQAGQISRSVSGQVLGASVSMSRQVDLPVNIFEKSSTLIAGQGVGRRVASVTGTAQQAQSTLAAGLVISKVNGIAVGKTIVVNATLVGGTAGGRKQASVPSQQFLAAQRLFSGGVETTSVVSVSGIVLTRSASLVAGQGQSVAAVRTDRKILVNRIDLIRGAVRATKSSVTQGKFFNVTTSLKAGKTTGGSVKPPTGQVRVGLQVRSAANVKLEAK